MIPNLRLRVSTPLVDLLTIPIFLVFSTAISYVLISRCLGWMCISLIESFLKLFKTLCTFYGSKFGWRATLRHAVQRGHVTATVRVVACRQLESDRISSHSHHRPSCSAPDRYLSISTILRSMAKQRLQDEFFILVARRMWFDTEGGRVTMSSTTRLPCERPLGTIPP